jgi:hypothetical protein
LVKGIAKFHGYIMISLFRRFLEVPLMYIKFCRLKVNFVKRIVLFYVVADNMHLKRSVVKA